MYRTEKNPTKPVTSQPKHPPLTEHSTPITPPLKASQIVQVRIAPTLHAAIQSEDAFAEENWSKKRRSKQLKSHDKPIIPMIVPVHQKP